MGPGSWAALGRACGMALARTVLDPTVGGKTLVSQIQWAVANRNYAMAQAMLQQLRRRDAELYERLMAEMGEGPGETDGG
ncbi:MAG: cyclodeaminase/cyclohydrolase family protein [Alphaproteobacteria bacterium]|nr:cyclodeaminase/cyclohydrolase family protein [Alphaproteobacteria bacterium]